MKTRKQRDQHPRKVAKAFGQKTYVSPIPCEVCGGWRRWVKSQLCKQCYPKEPK